MTLSIYSDEYFMKEAMKEAQKAFDQDEVPVGAVIVCNNKIIARTHNLTETLTDATAHAEMQAFTSASGFIGGKYLKDCTLFVTLEPCLMCAGAAFWSQIGRIVYGAKDEKRGHSMVNSSVLHPSTEVITGLFETESKKLLQDFFAKKRDS